MGAYRGIIERGRASLSPTPSPMPKAPSPSPPVGEAWNDPDNTAKGETKTMPMTSWRWIQFHHNADASNWYGDSAAWMRAALREDAESGRERGKSGRDIDHHRLNVGLVSAGIAIELVYKVILIADRGEFKATHDIRTLHGLLEARKGRVEGILLEEGWPTVEAFLDFMDNDLRHADGPRPRSQEDGGLGGSSRACSSIQP